MTAAAKRRMAPALLDAEALEEALKAAPWEILDRLAWRFTPSMLRAARLRDRNWLLKSMGDELIAVALTGGVEGLAVAVHAKLLCCHKVHWRGGALAPLKSEKHALAHAVLRLDGGKVLEVRSLVRFLGPVAKKTAGNGAAPGANSR